MTPADIAKLPPMVEILRLAANIEQPVDRTGPAHHLAARLNDRAAAKLGLRLGPIQPVHLRIDEALAVAERNMKPETGVLAAGFEQQDTMLPACGQPVRQHAAGRACADDDIVELHHAAAAAGAFAPASCRIMSDAFSPIITQAALVLPDTTVGMIDASATRKPTKPRTRKRSSTTAVTSEPMRQVDVGWNTVVPFWRANSSRSASLETF